MRLIFIFPTFLGLSINHTSFVNVTWVPGLLLHKVISHTSYQVGTTMANSIFKIHVGSMHSCDSPCPRLT